MHDFVARESTLSGKLDDAQEAQALEAWEVVTQLNSDFAKRDELYKRIDEIIFGEHEVRVPKAYEKTTLVVKSPLPSHQVNTITAALTINPPKPIFEPAGFGDSWETNATLREHFFKASFRRQEEDAKRRIFRCFMYDLVSKGEAVVKTVERTKTAWAKYTRDAQKCLRELEAEHPMWDDDARDRMYHARTEEMKRRAPYPIVSIDVPPESFKYIKTEQGFTFCAEIKQVPYYDALSKYGKAFNSHGDIVPEGVGLARSEWHRIAGDQSSLTLVEAWTWKDVIYFLIGPNARAAAGTGKLGRGTVVNYIANHGYGDPATKTLRGPYHHARGISTSVRLPEKAGLGVLYGFLDLYPLLDSLLTVQGNVAYLYGFPAFRRRGDPSKQTSLSDYGSENKEEEATLEIKPGAIYPYDVEPIPPAQGVELDKTISLVRSLTELALPSVVQGVVDGDSSGYALNQATRLARLAWNPIIDNAKFAWAEKVGFESWLIENKIGEKVYVWGEKPRPASQKVGDAGWIGVGPDDLKGIHRYRVELDPELPSNKVIELRQHEAMLKLRLEAPNDAINELGGNPDEVERAWLLYDLKHTPEVQQRLKARVFEMLGTIDQKRLQGPAQIAAGATGGQVQPDGSVISDPNAGQVYQPGQNGMPLEPTPQGAVTGMGPAGAALGGVAPVVQGPPQQHAPLPGEG